MKNLVYTIIFAFALSSSFAQQVGIGTTSPDPNAQLEVSSTDKGVFLPRMSQTEVDDLATNLDATDNGMLVYNSAESCIQIWTDTEFECIFVTSGTDAGNGGQVKVNIRGAGNQTALAAANADDDTFPGYLEWGVGAIDQGDVLTLDVATTDLVLSSFPTTSWPENEPNPGLSAIFTNDQNFPSETNDLDAWYENGTPGQVHVWRIIVYANYTSTNNFAEGNLTCSIRNPESGFITSSSQFTPSQAGIYEMTFLLITIADNVSLPSPNGTGLGYVFQFQNSENILDEVWVDSVARISLFAD